MRYLILSLFICSLTMQVGAATQPTVSSTRQHPYVFISQPEIDHARERAKKLPWARKALHQVLANADNALSAPVNIPDKPGQWTHHYVCKACGTRLTYQHGHHICPACHREYTGWPYDEVIAARQHIQNIDDIRDLGLAFAFTHETRYAQRARELLLGYADRYTSYPIHDYQGGQMQRGGRLFAQTLDESVRAMPLAWGYDLVANAPCMSDADRAHIERDLLRPWAATIQRNPAGVSNWQSWHDAALVSIGYLLHDNAMVDNAISSFHFQMNNSVLPDGFWYEGSASYHFYSLEAINWAMLATKNAGLNLFEDKRFRSLFDAPLNYTFPDGTFPAVNDSDPVQLRTEAERYELAYSWYKAEPYAAAAALGKRNSIQALLWGADELPPTTALAEKSVNFEGLGAVMLRQGSGDKQVVAHLDYGPHGGAHGHFDKLALILYANGSVISPDPARLAYGAPLQNQWYKTSLAHNTLIVDGKNQNATTGTLIDFMPAEKFAAAAASADDAYPGVKIARSVALTPDYLLDVVFAESDTTHTYDLAWHFYGTAKTDLPLSQCDSPGTTDGYQVLRNLRSSSAPVTTCTVDYQYRKHTIRQTTMASKGATFYLADGYSDNPPTTVPLTISRQTGTSACFVTLVEPDHAAKPVTWSAERLEADRIEIFATTKGGGRHEYQLRLNAHSTTEPRVEWTVDGKKQSGIKSGT